MSHCGHGDVTYVYNASLYLSSGRRGSNRVVVGFTTTYTISAYHHYSCEFESRSGEVYNIK